MVWIRDFAPQQDIQKVIGPDLMPSTTLDIRLQALDWLFAATRPWLFQGQASALQFPCGDDLDWKTVSALAYFHNLEPVLYWVVSDHESIENIPGWLKERWERAYFGNFLKNEEYFHVLEVLLGRCAKEGISVIVLKGPALIGRCEAVTKAVLGEIEEFPRDGQRWKIDEGAQRREGD